MLYYDNYLSLLSFDYVDKLVYKYAKKFYYRDLCDESITVHRAQQEYGFAVALTELNVYSSSSNMCYEIRLSQEGLSYLMTELGYPYIHPTRLVRLRARTCWWYPTYTVTLMILDNLENHL